MANEFTYCPRLFFLEWVQARFEHNDDTADGVYAHRHVDRPTGAVPLPEEGELRTARSLQLSSTKLGLVAKIDVLEGHDGVVHPVERKRGRAPDNVERSWEPERVQLCVQGLLLRDDGFRCDSGFLSFAESRERVEVVFDDALVERTEELLAQLRQVSARDLPPDPLVDSPKCPRCSLVGICLPDETNALAGRQALPLRRILPRDPVARPVYVTEQGAVVGRDGGRLEVKAKGERLLSVRLLDVSQLCVYGNAQVSTQLLRELFTREIPVCWFSYGGWFSGLAHGLPSKHVELRRQQVSKAGQGGLELARTMIAGKIRNSRTLLRRNARSEQRDALNRLAAAERSAKKSRSYAELLGVEGAAARAYFECFPSMLSDQTDLPGAFTWDGRTRRPPRDAVNCLLSYAYALLVKDLTIGATLVGFDPYLGFLHRPRFGRPALALDLAEEFRPLVGDSVVVHMINNGEVSTSDFVSRAGGVSLTAGGRKKVLAAYERRLDIEIRHPVFGYRLTYRRVLDVQLRLLAAHLLHETPSYAAFCTR